VSLRALAQPAILVPGNIRFMSSPRWSDVEKDWEPDGALRDIYVQGTSEADWQRVVNAVRAKELPWSYSEDGEHCPMPDSVDEIFNRRSHVAILWAITPVSGIQINCHFFTSEEIEFDLTPTEIVGQPELDVVVEFVRLVGRASEKLASVCYENWPDEPFMLYDPTADLVTLLGVSS
jgi:hypothetical protein